MLDVHIDTVATRPVPFIGGRRVLIVEDEAIIAEFLADVLVDMGHQVCAVAATEDEAMDAARRTRPDLMLIDANLTAGTGLNAAERILRSGYIPHVVMSGERTMLARLGGAVTLEKPFTDADLARAIASATQSPIDRPSNGPPRSGKPSNGAR